MGGGKGGGGGEIPYEIENAAERLRFIGEQQYNLGLPLLQTGAGQLEELLTTGTVGALQPAIGSTVEQARSGASNQLTQLRENLTRQGVTGTALQEAMAQGRAGAASEIGGIPAQFTMPTLTQIAGPLGNLTAQGVGAVGQAGQIGGMAAGPASPAGGGARGALGGAMSGAASGAMIGSVVPVIGTTAGAIGGGVMGALGGK